MKTKTLRALLLVAMVAIVALAVLTACGGSVTVNFVSDGEVYHTVTVDETTTSITLPQKPTKDGHYFGGWYLDDGTFANPVTEQSLFELAQQGNVTVYAKWNVGEEPCEHNWVDATCLLPKTCSICSETQGEALGHTGGTATCTAKAVCTRCNVEYGELAQHQFTVVVNTDPVQHWNKCANCDAIDQKVDHSAIVLENDCTKSIVCTCGKVLAEANAEHEFTVWLSNSATHWHQCAHCDVLDTPTSHDAIPTTYDCTVGVTCACGEVLVAPKSAHNYNYNVDEATHQKVCSNANCNYAETASAHDNVISPVADCTVGQTCVCGKVLVVANSEHTFNVAQKDATHHWNKCEHCSVTDTKVAHDQIVEDNDCTTGQTCSCGHELVVACSDHDFDNFIWGFNDESHWKICGNSGCQSTKGQSNHIAVDPATYCTMEVKCACNKVIKEATEHSLSYAPVDGDKYNHRQVCANCSFVGENELHDGFMTDYNSDGTQHWTVCTRCSYEHETHTNCDGDKNNATCGEKRVCATCQNEYGAALEHDLATQPWVTTDQTNHYKLCGRCEQQFDVAAHDYVQEVEDEAYAVDGAEGTFYKSCLCGKAGTETFEIALDSCRFVYIQEDSFQNIPASVFGCSHCDMVLYITNSDATSPVDSAITIVKGTIILGYSTQTGIDVTLPDSVVVNGETINIVEIADKAAVYNSSAYCAFNASVNVEGRKKQYLRSIVLGKYITKIGTSAFNGLESLQSVTFGDSVEIIGNQAFYNCKNLVELRTNEKLPISVLEGYDDSAGVSTYLSNFDYIIEKTSDSNIKVTDDLFVYAIDPTTEKVNILGYNGTETTITIPTTIENKACNVHPYAFYYNSKLIKVIIPADAVGEIGNYAFAYSAITEITLGEGLGQIRDYAFAYSAITELTLPESITYISNSAFVSCESLEEVTINSKLTSGTGTNVFKGCTALKTVTIGVSVTKIGSTMFDGCSVLETVYFNATTMGNGSSSANMFKKAGVSAPNGITVYIGSGVVAVPGNIFTQQSTSSSYKNYITKVEFASGSNCTTLNDNAFQNMTSLTSINLPNGLEKIGMNAFKSCTALVSIVIPDSVKSIAGLVSTSSCSAFNGCTKLESVTLPTNAEFVTIGASMFSGCSVLKEIVVPNSVTTIEKAAFQNCKALKIVTIGSGVSVIGNQAFDGCTAIETLNYNATNVADLETSSAIFNKAGTTGAGITVNFGKNVEKIPAYLFYKGSSTSNVTANVIAVVFEEGSVCATIGTNAFDSCSSITSLKLPSSLNAIGSNAFSGCSGLQSIIIERDSAAPQTLSVGDNAFAGSTCNIYYEVGQVVGSTLAALGSGKYYANVEEAYAVSGIGFSNPNTGSYARWYFYLDGEPNDTQLGYCVNYWKYDTDGVTPVVVYTTPAV